MSGSGGGGGYTPPDEGTPCDRLQFEASVSSPQAAAVKTLSVGQILEVHYRQQGQTRSIVLVTQGGVDVGALVTRTADLLRCIQAGVDYVAEVIGIQGGNVTVHVRAA